MKLKPGWDSFVWTIPEYRRFSGSLIATDLIDFFLAEKLWVKASDVLRLAVSHWIGGAYADLDTYWYRQLEDTLLDSDFVFPTLRLPAEKKEKFAHYLDNSFLTAEAGSALILMLIDFISAMPRRVLK